MDLRLRRPRADGTPHDEIRNVLRRDRVEELNAYTYAVVAKWGWVSEQWREEGWGTA